ncbi:MAG: MarR family transcriptional regulator [Candidatus Dormiibacterota bacterium]
MEVGLAAGVSSHLVALWIDLVRQAGGVNMPAPHPQATRLTRQQFRALSCLEAAPLTMTALARCLGISPASATATADRLVSAGAAERSRDATDRRLVRVVATLTGVRMAQDYRSEQVATLEELLAHLDPARKSVISLAMGELAAGIEVPQPLLTGNLLTPAAERWNSN